MDQLPENMRILRLFGADKQALDALLAAAEKNKGISIECMEKGGEVLLLLQVMASSSVAITAALDGWQAQVLEKCGGALYAVGDATLPQMLVSVFAKKKMLFACVDAQTSALVEEKLGGFAQLDHVYDFGKHSHAHPKYARKIALGSSFAKKYPDQTAQQVAGQVKVAYQYSGADLVLGILPQEDGSHFIMVGEKAGYWLRRVPVGENTVLWAFDILRRAALDAPQAKGTVRLAYAAKMPPFAMTANVAAQDEAITDFDQSDFEAPPAPEAAAHGASKVIFSIALMLLIAMLTLALLYAYTGGDIASLWYDSGLDRFNVSSATLLALAASS